MRLSFSSANTEGDVELFFVLPLLTEDLYLGIPETAVRSKESLAVLPIDKGRTRKRYVPDFIAYCEGLPVLVVEAKSPEEALDDGFGEAQLYAAELNKRFPSDINPVRWVVATNGRDLVCGKWDEAKPTFSSAIAKLLPGSKAISVLKSQIGWESLQAVSSHITQRYLPKNWHLPSEYLGENRVALAKAGHNSLYNELEPMLRRYFNPQDKEFEEEIIKHAYVSTDETTKYERSFEDYLRTRVIPLSDERGEEIKTTKKSAENFSRRLEKLSGRNQPFMQLVIGGVGSGRTSFLKRYFNYTIDPALKERIVYCRINFNTASDDLEDIRKWICLSFIETVRENFSHVIDLTKEQDLMSVFSKEIRDNQGAYSLLRKSSEEKYNERLAGDLFTWMADPEVFSRALARSLQGDRALGLVIAFDNVDRREREAQLKIFQTGQWFMTHTRSVCIMTLRDETFEAYKDEKPLDAFLKTGNFYIRPPRFVDMVSKRLDLVIEYLAKQGGKKLSYDIEGLGTVTYPATSLGKYLTAVYVDLFKKKRRITLVLEGLSGRNARRSLEMFSAVLTSAHFDTREFTSSALSSGAHHIQETVLLRALMRTNYLYFTPAHGFVRNVYDFAKGSDKPSHFLKYELLRYLVENRKKQGDIRFEGYFTVEHLCNKMSALGFEEKDTVGALNDLVGDELIVSEDLTLSALSPRSAVRVRPAGYVHVRILAQRTEYVAACALITPIADSKLANRIGALWHINDPHTDIRSRSKREAASGFLEYLKGAIDRHRGGVGLAEQQRIGASLVNAGYDALKFSRDPTVPVESSVTEEKEFDRLFGE